MLGFTKEILFLILRGGGVRALFFLRQEGSAHVVATMLWSGDLEKISKSLTMEPFITYGMAKK